jgi:hypothetical protein
MRAGYREDREQLLHPSALWLDTESEVPRPDVGNVPRCPAPAPLARLSAPQGARSITEHHRAEHSRLLLRLKKNARAFYLLLASLDVKPNE